MDVFGQQAVSIAVSERVDKEGSKRRGLAVADYGKIKSEVVHEARLEWMNSCASHDRTCSGDLNVPCTPGIGLLTE